MRPALAAGQFEQGLASAIDAVDALLRQHCPQIDGKADRNELNDAPDLR